MRTLITTDNVPPAERFDYYCAAILRQSVPMRLRSDTPAGFAARLDGAALGPLTMSSLTTRISGAYRVQRCPKLIRRSDPDAYRLLIDPCGTTQLDHNGHHATFAPGDIALYDTSRTFDGQRNGAGVGRLAIMTFPRDLLPLGESTIRPLLGAPISGSSGLGALLSMLVIQTINSLGQFRPEDEIRLSAAMLDLLGATLAHELEGGRASQPPIESRQHVVFAQVLAFVQQRLTDPALSPRMIAAAHHLSLRSLHRLFQANGLSAAAWIRERRLDRCRHDLADPLLSGRPVSAIGRRWGFHEPAHFSRAFKAAFGVSPQAYRDCWVDERLRRLTGPALADE